MWDKDSLCQLVSEKMSGYHLVSVSNREPYIHAYDQGEVCCQVPASGLTTALDPVMRACGGTWVAHGSGDADREVVDSQDRVSVPPGEDRYTLRRVWLTKEEEQGYYFGFSNEALWPLCHIAYNRPVFRKSDWETYEKVNRRFADAVIEEVQGKKAFVFIQDYHLALLSRMLTESNPNIITAQFWHIPWPNPEAFRICPWQTEILDGLLGNHLLGFHIRYHCNNFLDTVDRTIEARVDRERITVTKSGKVTSVKPFPISVDYDEIEAEATRPEIQQEIRGLKKRLGIKDEKIGLGLDRIDYTKGILERLQAFDLFLELSPQYKGKVTFIQGGVPSRTHIGAYKDLNDDIDGLIDMINWKHSQEHWKPIVYLKEHIPSHTMSALRCMADFCTVSSLHDGMNLVAKEFVASRADEDGVLILSPFTGAAREFSDALQVNPYAIDNFARTIKDAIEMPEDERRRRMRKMRSLLKENNIYKWAGDIITELSRFEFGDR
ncbi:MAG: trehalose-6-phosphate synthase [Chloroflexi bacterium]|nr:trehalose-6-phosphate synthase [Chloroflexota bacterium]